MAVSYRQAMSDADHRADIRANVFLLAVIDSAAGTMPVRIRNLSPNGALLEGADLPLDDVLTLRRGELHVSGEVAWRGDGFCGMRFGSEINVEKWIKRVVHSGQERVDGIMQALKSGAIPHANSDTSPPADAHDLIAQLLALVEQMADAPGMTTALGEQMIKLEALIVALQGCVPRSQVQKSQPRSR